MSDYDTDRVKTKIIGNHEVTVTLFPGKYALKLWIELMKAFGPSISSLSGSILKDKQSDINMSDIMSSEFNVQDVLDGITQALQNFAMESEDFITLVDKLLANTMIDNKEVNDRNFDQFFMTNYNLLFRVLFFVIECNYKSFLASWLSSNKPNQVQPEKGPELSLAQTLNKTG